MSEVANVADNPSYNDDEDETTNVKISPGPAPKAHTKVEKRRSSGIVVRKFQSLSILTQHQSDHSYHT